MMTISSDLERSLALLPILTVVGRKVDWKSEAFEADLSLFSFLFAGPPTRFFAQRAQRRRARVLRVVCQTTPKSALHSKQCFGPLPSFSKLRTDDRQCQARVEKQPRDFQWASGDERSKREAVEARQSERGERRARSRGRRAMAHSLPTLIGSQCRKRLLNCSPASPQSTRNAETCPS